MTKEHEYIKKAKQEIDEKFKEEQIQRVKTRLEKISALEKKIINLKKEISLICEDKDIYETGQIINPESMNSIVFNNGENGIVFN